MGAPDTGWSWMVAICCCYIHFALFGLFRSSGVMYVALLHTYQVTREEAAWPFSLCSAVFQMTGPLASIATHYISVRTACLFGSAIATIGVTCCCFANDILWINISYGVVHGIGFGFAVTLVPVIVNQYFVRHRATAIGIAFSGGTVSSFIFPAAMELLLDTYGLGGSFLVLGGVVMNTLVASSLLRPPPWMKKTTVDRDSHPELDERVSEGKDSGLSTSMDMVYQVKSKSTVNDEDNVIHHNDCEMKGSDEHSTLYQSPDNSYKEFHSNEQELPLVEVKQVTVVPKSTDSALDDNSHQLSLNTDSSFRHSAVCRNIMEVLAHPMFHVLTFSMCIFFLVLHSFFMVIVDFSTDKGIPESSAIYVLSVFSLFDLTGRLGLGWVTDRGFIKRKNMVMMNLAIIGVLNNMYPIVNSLTSILIVSAFHGLAVGSSITIFFVLQAEYLGLEKLALVLGMTNFINGTLTFLRPGMTGLFRDEIGSYDWMFHFLGILALAASALWLAEPWLRRQGIKKEYKNKLAEQSANERHCNC